MAEVIASYEEIEQMKKAAAKTFFPTALSYLRTHNGYRPGNIHVFLGQRGAGKSTQMRTMLVDYLALGPKKKPCLIYLSEETPESFQAQLFHGFSGRSEEMNNILMFSEQSSSHMKAYDSAAKKIDILIEEVIATDPEILFIDNITTGGLYDGNYGVQKDTVAKLKGIAIQLNIPVVIFAHTGNIHAGVDRLIEDQDIKGVKILPDVSEFFYIMQRFTIGEEFYPTVRLTKSRGQELREGALFLLEYRPALRMYSKGKKLSFADFKEAFKRRNRL